MKHLTKAYSRLMRYAMFMGILGGIASFIDPPHHGLIKAWIGVTVGAMLLGHKLPDTLKEFFKITDEITDEIFPE